MYNVLMKMNKPKKVFCAEERDMIIDFVKNNKVILENKGNDSRTIRTKREKWEELSRNFTEKGFNRDWCRLRDYYHRLKCSAKVNIIAYKKHINQTGFAPEQTPNDYEWAIHDICPEDFNIYDNNKEADLENPNIVYIKQDTSEDMFYEETSNNRDECDRDELQEETNHPTSPNKTWEKRKPEISTDLLRKTKIPKMSDLEVDNAACRLLENKQKMELTLHKQRLEFSLEKHRKDMECANLTEQKLMVELETAKIFKLKLEKEAQKLDLELEILKRKLDST